MVTLDKSKIRAIANKRCKIAVQSIHDIVINVADNKVDIITQTIKLQR